jgi:glucosamine kinase
MTPKRPAVQPSNRPSAYAGIDAGGSHTEAVIIRADRTELARATGGPGAVRPDNVVRVAAMIARTVKRAAKAAGNPSLTSLVIAAAGAGRAAERTALRKAMAKHKVARKIAVIGDGEAALESAFPGQPGIIVISGTGSIAYARDLRGKLHRAGGLGPHMGDEGSGFALGRAALAAAGKASDGRGPATIMMPMIHEATSTDDLDTLIRWAQKATREEIAALGGVARDAAAQGDPLARELVEGAAHELLQHVVALLARTHPDPPGAIATSGGLMAGNSPVRARFVAALERWTPQLRIVESSVDPAMGAASLAMRL